MARLERDRRDVSGGAAETARKTANLGGMGEAAARDWPERKINAEGWRIDWSFSERLSSGSKSRTPPPPAPLSELTAGGGNNFVR